MKQKESALSIHICFSSAGSIVLYDCFYVILKNIGLLPEVFRRIFEEAFGLRQVVAGGFGAAAAAELYERTIRTGHLMSNLKIW